MALNIKKNMCVLSLLTTVLGEGSEFELKLNCIQQLYFSWRFQENGMKVKQEHSRGEMLGKNREASLLWRGCEEKPLVSHTVWERLQLIL